MNQAEKRIDELRKQLSKYNFEYYTLASPSISDTEFDFLLKELEILEKENPQFFDENSPTQKVGGTINKTFETYTHQLAMLSLGNTYNEAELLEFDERVAKGLGTKEYEYVCELKFDGLSISLHYEDGLLVRAVTRGDGVAGDVVTDNVKTINALNARLQGDLPKKLEARGEIFMHRIVFDKINEQRLFDGEQPFANPRNVASGTIKLQDSAEVAKRPLDICLYQIIGEDISIKTHWESLEMAKIWGLKVSDAAKKVATIKEVLQFIKYWETERYNLGFDIDGVVIKINDFNQRAELGFTAKTPRWAISYKFKTQAVSTILSYISYQVGRTGSITPVANLEPVQLLGTTIKRASLHNANEIIRLDIREGDTVFVEKGGEIIPKITGVNLEKRPQNTLPTNYISHCPECGSELVRLVGEANHYCLNEQYCTPQIIGKLQHFTARKACDIQSLGEETLSALYYAGLVKNIADLYDLKMEEIAKLERLGEKSAKNILDGLLMSKTIPFHNVLFGMGIRYVGATVAKKLANHFKNIDAIAEASEEELENVEEIGKVIAQSVFHYFRDINSLAMLERLKQAGLQFATFANDVIYKSNILEGKTLVISGVFERFSRDEIGEMILAHKGKQGSAITGKTDYLIAGENMGPAKLEKAKKLNVKILTEDDFLELIGN